MTRSNHSTSGIVDLGNTLKQRLLILASTAKDGEVASKVLTAADMDCLVCADSEQLMEELARGARALLLAEEVLTGESLQRLGSAISAQPNWSDLPILILTQHGANSPVIHHVLQHLGNIQLMERPVRVPP